MVGRPSRPVPGGTGWATVATMIVARTCWALGLGLLALTGCRSLVPAPYARGKAPSSAELLERTGAQLPALQVSKAKVVANRTQRGNLAFLAEAPGRFRGTVDVAGNELVTLAFHEQGYALRYKLDAFPEGFYAGPPSACAVEALLGVRFDTEGLVDLVLGGAPVIEGPHEVLEQKWDRRGGWERLVIANATLVQELRFGWVAGQWRVMGGQLWERQGKERGRRLWTVEHIDLEPEGNAYLPTKTKVSTPGKRRDDTVVISYKERDPDPAFAKREGDDTGDGGDTGDDPWGEDDGGDPWEEEEGGWEGEGGQPAGGEAEGDEDDGGWEGGEDTAGTPEAAAKPGEAPKTGDTAKPGEATTPTDAAQPGDTTPPATQPTAARPKAKPTKPATPTIPPEFQLEPSGLTVRGDLCR
jgi:hypothetical protein